MSTRNTGLRLKVLGTRGSMATNREDQAIFGTATSCYMVRAGEETVFLDAGNGLLAAPVDFPRPPHILLSHLHLDHLLGLGMYPRLAKKGLETTIHVPAPRGKDPAKILERVYSPPFWPVSLASYAGDVRILPLSFPFQIGEVTVEGIPGATMSMKRRPSSVSSNLQRMPIWFCTTDNILQTSWMITEDSVIPLRSMRWNCLTAAEPALCGSYTTTLRGLMRSFRRWLHG